MPTSADLIAKFADRVDLPIPLDEVKDWLLERGYQDEINFIPVDLDTGVIRGFLKRVRHQKGGWDTEPLEISNIYYDRSQGAEWINIVCAKELLHILDAATCSTRDEFNKLTSRLALPADMKHLAEDPAFAIVDKMGDLPAAALLLPPAAREVLLAPYEQGVLTDEAISELAMIPAEHVRSVMSGLWPSVYQIIMGGFPHLAPNNADQISIDFEEPSAAED